MQDEAYYDEYNRRFAATHGHLSMEPYKAAATAYKEQVRLTRVQYAHFRACMRMHMHTHAHTCMHTHAHAHACTHALTQIYYCHVVSISLCHALPLQKIYPLQKMPLSCPFAEDLPFAEDAPVMSLCRRSTRTSPRLTPPRCGCF